MSPEEYKAARESAILTQGEGAAIVIGIAKQTYCDWEAGNVVPAVDLWRLVRFLIFLWAQPALEWLLAGS